MEKIIKKFYRKVLTSQMTSYIIKKKSKKTSQIERSENIKTFTLRLNEEQHQLLESKARALNISKNDFIRMLIDGEVQADKQEKILLELEEIKEILKKQK